MHWNELAKKYVITFSSFIFASTQELGLLLFAEKKML
jgi:hypothetical protein